MPTLRQSVAEKKAQERTVRVNPEIDARLDRFIQDKPDLYGYYNELSKEQLIRKLMLAKMRRGDQRESRNEEILAWVGQHPDIKVRIEEQVKNVPAENRQRAFINAAKTEAMKEGMKGPRIQP
jgi:hypothetical protein